MPKKQTRKYTVTITRDTIVEAKDEEEAYQIGKEDGGLFDSRDQWHGDWEVDPEIKQCTEDGDDL